MGKRSSRESKSRHWEKHQVRKILLDGSFRDRLIAETVYTPENALVVQEQLQSELGFTANPAEYGEVLVGPGFESPTLADEPEDEGAFD